MNILNPLRISNSPLYYRLSCKEVFNSRTYCDKTKSEDAKDIDLSLYLVVGSHYGPDNGKLILKSKRFVEGGGTTIQLRFMPPEIQKYTTLAKLIKQRIGGWGNGNAKLIINDDVGVAIVAKAGLHIGPNDMHPEDAAEDMNGRPIGFTAECLDDVIKADNLQCITYIGIQVFPSKQSKETSNKIWGIEGLQEAISLTKKRIVAIGGITEENVSEIVKILRPGDGVAIAGDILKYEDPYAVTQRIRKIIDDHFKAIGNKE